MHRLVPLALAVGLLAVGAAAGGASTRQTVPLSHPQPADRALAAQDAPDPAGAGSPAPAVHATLPSGTWRPLGPSPIGPPYLSGGDYYGGPYSGRVTSVAVLPGGQHPGRIVLGSAGGGVWTSDNGGTTWLPRTDTQPDLAIGAVAVDPSNPNHLLAGTGEASQSADSFPGDGVLVSQNGGTTWTRQDPGGVFDGVAVAQLAIVPGHSGRQFAATSAGLFMTTDGGTTWAKPTDASYAGVDGNITAVAVNPAHPATVFVAGGPSVVAKSTDGGVHWAASAGAIAAPGESPFTALAISASTPTVMYAAVGSETAAVALYKSKDGGGSWSALTVPDYTGDAYAYGSGTEEMGWYDNALAIDPANQAHVVVGGITVLETSNGGSTWRNLNGQQFQWPHNKLHPHMHALAFAGGKVWLGGDGGVSTYAPSTRAVANANGNLNISQLYSGFSVVNGKVLAGAQGNAAARTSKSTASAWTAIYGGEGGPVAITPNDPALQFIVVAGLLWASTDGFASSFNLVMPSTYISSYQEPVAVIPNDATPSKPTLLFGAFDVWRTVNPAAAAPTWKQVTFRNGHVTAFAVAPSNPNVVYAGFDDGKILVSTNRGITFTRIGNEPGGIPYVTGISVDPANPQAITASFSVASTRSAAPAFAHVAQYAYTTNPLAGAWTLISGDLPDAAVSHVVYDGGALLAATDAGVYGTDAVNGFSTHWTRIGTGLPNVQVQDLAVAGGAVYAATHGRGAWRLP